MTPNLQPSDSVQPLSVGNVVNAGFRLYGARAKEYLQIATIATLWVLLPYGVAIGLVIFFAIVQNYYTWLGLLIPALPVLFVFTLAKYLANTALIARLAFNELTNQPESLKEARRYTNSRKWRLLLMSLLLGLLIAAAIVPLYILLVFLFFGMVTAAGGSQILTGGTPSPENVNAGLLLLLLLVSLVLLVGIIVFFLWLNARLVAPDLPIAVEPEATAFGSIDRIWNLTKGGVWRIVLILLITFAVTLPLQMLAQLLAEFVQPIVQAILPRGEAALITGLASLIGAVLGFILSIVTLPLWQIIKAVIYYDLRVRREGLGLELRDRDA
jgi:hypothetical protein